MNYTYDIIIKDGFYFLLSNPDESSDTISNWSSVMHMLGQFFFLTLIFIAIMVSAVYILKFAGRFRNYSGGNNNLRIVESRSLGGNNFIHLVKSGGKYVLIGTSKDNVAFLADVDNDTVTDIFEKMEPPKFEAHLQKHIKKLFNKDKDNYKDTDADA